MDFFTDFHSSQKILIILIVCILFMLLKAFKGIVKMIVIPLLLIAGAIWYFNG